VEAMPIMIIPEVPEPRSELRILVFKEKRFCKHIAVFVFIPSPLPLMPAKRVIKKN
jgi:hypothetical protein